jgi:hypothetical protein
MFSLQEVAIGRHYFEEANNGWRDQLDEAAQ